MCKSTRNRRGLLIALQRDLTHAHCNIHCEYIYMRLLFEDGYYSKCGVYSEDIRCVYCMDVSIYRQSGYLCGNIIYANYASSCDGP